MITLPTISQIRERALITWRSLDQTISTSRFSDAWIRSHTSAMALWGLYAQVDNAQRDIFPDTATNSALEKHAAQKGLYLKDPTTSEVELGILLTGAPGYELAAGYELAHLDGTDFVSTSGGVVDGNGEILVSAKSTTTGTIANKEVGEQLTFVQPPASMDRMGEVVVDFKGGSDKETHESLLSRLLEVLRSPPGGGTAGDYRRWAKEVDGIADAFVFPINRGLGTVDVVPLVEGGDRVPTEDQIIVVREHIEPLRPVTALAVYYVRASSITVDVSALFTLATGYDWESVKLLVEAQLDALFSSLEPGDATLHLSTIICACREVEGVADVVVSAPVDNVTSILSKEGCELLVPGIYTLEEAQ